MKINEIVINQKNRGKLKKILDSFYKDISTYSLPNKEVSINQNILHTIYSLSSDSLSKIELFDNSNIKLSIADIEYIKENIEKYKKSLTFAFGVYEINVDTLFTLDKEALQSFKKMSNPDLDSVMINLGYEPSFITRIIFKNFYKYIDFDNKKDTKLISALFTKYLSYTMFFLMPFVALMLWLIYKRLKKHYYEYFIFSIHTHTIFFFFASIEIMIRGYFTENFVPYISIIGMFPYSLFAMKKVYDQSWIKTLFKSMILTLCYSTVLIVSIACVLFAAVFLF